MNNLHTAHYRLPFFFRPAGVFLNATPSFFRLGEPDLNLNRGFLLLAFTNLFQAESLRVFFLCLVSVLSISPIPEVISPKDL